MAWRCWCEVFEGMCIDLVALPQTVAGVHIVKLCNSSDHPSMSEAGDSQLSTGSCLIYTNDSESFLDKVKLA